MGPSIGVDIGGSKVLAVSLGAAGEIEAVEKLPIPPDAATDDVIAIVLAARRGLSRHGRPRGGSPFLPEPPCLRRY